MSGQDLEFMRPMPWYLLGLTTWPVASALVSVYKLLHFKNKITFKKERT